MISGSGGSSRNKLPSFTAPLSRFSFTGQVPRHGEGSSGQGMFADILAAYQNYTGNQAFGGLSDLIPGAQQAGADARSLAADGTNQGYNNLMGLAQMGFGPLEQGMDMAGLAPNALNASNYYMTSGVTPAVQGGNVFGASGAGQQVVDAALGAARQMPADAYQRVVAEGLPEVRSSYSARGLGTGGESARGEQDYISRTRDALYQQDVANQIAALGAGASASGAAAAQAIGAQNAAIGRGNLGLQASSAIPGILGSLVDTSGRPLGFMEQLAGLQGRPLDLAGQGLDLYGKGLNLPLQYQQALYEFTRSPEKYLLNAMNGLPTGENKNFGFGIASKPSSGGGGGGGGGN